MAYAGGEEAERKGRRTETKVRGRGSLRQEQQQGVKAVFSRERMTQIVYKSHNFPSDHVSNIVRFLAGFVKKDIIERGKERWNNFTFFK